MLKLDNVTISYKNVPTVQNFNLDMKEGQIVSLVGESGSGKTTVIRAVLGLLAGGGKVTEGSITFEGEDLLSYTPEQWRKLRGSDISMIFQDSGAMMILSFPVIRWYETASWYCDGNDLSAEASSCR